MATHSSILAWKIPQTEEPGRLQSMGLQSWTRLCDFTFTFPSPGDLPNPGIKLLTEKRCTTWELQVKFYLGQNEDCSPGGSISDSSERLLQSGSRGESIYKVLVKGEHRVPPSTLNSLRGCWRSTAIAAWGSISVEADGKCLCCSVVGNAIGKCQFVLDTPLEKISFIYRIFTTI